MRHLVGDDVLASFEEAITAREAAGQRLDNRLVQIERAVIQDARLDGRTAEVDVRFDADIAAVTRDREGEVIAGSLSDAIPTHDSGPSAEPRQRRPELAAGRDRRSRLILPALRGTTFLTPSRRLSSSGGPQRIMRTCAA